MEADLHGIIQHILENKSRKGSRGFTTNDVQVICSKVKPILASEPSLLEIAPPLKVCGDIHGQLLDLLRVFKTAGTPPESKYLFLGDYVDRGKHSVEVIILLLSMKILYPDSIYLIRGNHESMEMSETFGFMEECQKKLDNQSWLTFLEVFDYLPIGAVVGNSIFCIHGGLSPHLKSLDDIRALTRPTPIPEEGLLSDLLWSDPSPSTTGFGPSDRGSTITWGENVAKKFLKANNLQFIVRGHQLAQNGFEFPFEPRCHTVTVFTASNYANECTNKAAFMVIDSSLNLIFNLLPKTRPEDIPKKETPSLTTDDILTRLSRPATARKFGQRRLPMQPRSSLRR